MRNPSGFGSCYKLSGKRRRPYIARVTIGWTDEGKQIYKTIGYYTTKKEGLAELGSYQLNPLKDIDDNITFKQIYEIWSEKKYTGLSDSGAKNYINSFKLTQELHDKKFKDIKYIHLQDMVDNLNREYPTLQKVKGFVSQLYDYAMKNDIVDKNYAKLIQLPKKYKGADRVPFTNDEIKVLWKNKSDDTVKIILIMIYTGFRVGEVLDLKIENVDLDLMTIRGGSKTDAGINRLIPINNKILPIIKYFYNKDNKYLLGKKVVSYAAYRVRFGQMMKELGMNHTIHECRHTFATLMNDSGANGTAIKKLIGHSDFAFTEKVYTHKSIDELRKAINMI